MGIGLTDDHRALAEALVDWARSVEAPAVVRRSEEEGPAVFDKLWVGLRDIGAAAIALPESIGGGQGSFLDLAVAVEAAAAGMVPGPLLPTAVAATVLPAGHRLLPAVADGSVTVAVGTGATTLELQDGRASGEARLVWGAGLTTHLLLPTREGGWLLAEAGDIEVEVADPVDLATRVGTARLEGAAAEPASVDGDRLGRVAVTLSAAEAAGIARWCLDTAVGYAKVREQFGRTIGSFQAIKHLCAEMLEAVESATAVAWDAARAFDEDDDQFALAAAAAGAVALDVAVRTAQDAVQVLGGIGFTWEHDVHLYLRRAVVNRHLVGGSDRWRLALAESALRGVRRRPEVELGDEAEAARAAVRPLVEQVASAEDQRAALVDAGLLMPHWPPPYGRGSSAVEQLVIDEELASADITRPSLEIGAWAAPTILEHGDDAQRERFLWPTLRGELVWCQLFSEPGAGSDLASLRTRAERTEGGWLLTGQKVWTSMAQVADWAICLARTNSDVPQHRGITYFLLDMGSDGIEVRPLRELTGEALFNEVFLDNVFVPDDCVVGEVDGGWPLARTTLANERVAISGSSLGVSVERVLAFASDTGDVSDLVRERIGEAVGAAAVTKALALRGTLRTLAGQGPGAESSVLKLVGVRQRQDSAELALDLLHEDALLGRGEGPSVVHEALVTRALSIAGGSTQVLRNVAGERILGFPRG